MSNLVLASFSRARAELLRAAGYAFTQEPSGVEERAYEPGEDPGTYVEYLATQKAEAVAKSFPESIVIGADTVLYMNGDTYGKPRDLGHAVEMLTTLSGRTHRLITGICVLARQGQIRRTAHDTVNVTMRSWSRARIERHVAIAKPLLYAGAYALQQEGCVMVERLDGDPNTVIGLPLTVLERMLEQVATESGITLSLHPAP